MLLNFIKRKNMPPKRKAMDPIKEMLNQIWDLSRVFEAPDNTDEFDTIQRYIALLPRKISALRSPSRCLRKTPFAMCSPWILISEIC